MENSKFLGGDLQHTHLVKGLDYALLQKVCIVPCDLDAKSLYWHCGSNLKVVDMTKAGYVADTCRSEVSWSRVRQMSQRRLKRSKHPGERYAGSLQPFLALAGVTNFLVQSPGLVAVAICWLNCAGHKVPHQHWQGRI